MAAAAVLDRPAPPRVSAEEYLAGELVSEVKHEFHGGEIVLMPGGSIAHARVIRNLVTGLSVRTRGTGCEAFGSETKLYVPATDAYYYPDAMIACPAEVIDARNGVIANPRVICEVLSPGTSDYDRGAKRLAYMSVPSVEEIVHLSSEERFVEIFRRESDHWSWRAVGGDADLPLLDGDIKIPLAEIYEGAL